MGTTLTTNLELIKPNVAGEPKKNWPAQWGTSADKLDTEVQAAKDRLTVIESSLTAYVPQLLALITNPNIGSTGTAEGFWTRLNLNIIKVWIRFLFSGTGIDPGNGNYSVTLPFKPLADGLTSGNSLNAGQFLGQGYARDFSTAANNALFFVQLSSVASASNAVRFFLPGTSAAIDDDTPFVWAVNDSLNMSFEYEADFS
jgi:hypothetical protein